MTPVSNSPDRWQIDAVEFWRMPDRLQAEVRDWLVAEGIDWESPILTVALDEGTVDVERPIYAAGSNERGNLIHYRLDWHIRHEGVATVWEEYTVHGSPPPALLDYLRRRDDG